MVGSAPTLSHRRDQEAMSPMWPSGTSPLLSLGQFLSQYRAHDCEKALQRNRLSIEVRHAEDFSEDTLSDRI
jgi:hypothetical protein